MNRLAASYKERDIIREAGDLFVIRVTAGVYEVYLSGATHAVRKAWVSFKSDDRKALIKAHEVFDRIAQQSAVDTTLRVRDSERAAQMGDRQQGLAEKRASERDNGR